MAAKSSTFYRLEKMLPIGKLQVYEFHTVVNGNLYYVSYVEDSNRHRSDRHEYRLYNDKEKGNKIYKQLKADGYQFAGIWEMDVLGHKKRIQEGKKCEQ